MENTSPLPCPACKKSLTSFKWRNIRLEHCDTGCHGVWFGRDKLKAVEKSDTFEAIDNAFEGAYQKKPLKQSLEGTPNRLCPKDGKVMDRYEWNVGSTLVMDACPECQGIWLDEGELEGFVGYVKSFKANPPELTPEIRAMIDDAQCQVDAEYGSVLNTATKSVIRWDLGFLDDILRFLIKVNID